MNRKEKRTLIRDIKGNKGLAKKHTKGAFGRHPAPEMRARKRKSDAKLQNAFEEMKGKSIPEGEKWLYKNKSALESVKKGLNDAKNGRISSIVEEK